jgi:hypothetical protein
MLPEEEPRVKYIISEEFEVGSRTFDRAAVGQTVTVELHNGFFGLPWSGGISPE